MAALKICTYNQGWIQYFERGGIKLCINVSGHTLIVIVMSPFKIVVFNVSAKNLNLINLKGKESAHKAPSPTRSQP